MKEKYLEKKFYAKNITMIEAENERISGRMVFHEHIVILCGSLPQINL